MKTATKATHTPGPWNHFDGSRYITATYNGIDTPIAEICVLPRKEKFPGYDGLETLTELTEAEEQNNANVLAAASEMLTELEFAQSVIDAVLRNANPTTSEIHDALSRLARIIAKAKGAA